MQIEFKHLHQIYRADLSKPVDLSIPLRDGMDAVNCFYAPAVEFSPVIAGNFIGSTRMGGLVNFFNVKFNPHGNGTHTECVGHISSEAFTINRCLKNFHVIAKLVSVFPVKTENGDRVIMPEQLKPLFEKGDCAAAIIRTMPNDRLKWQTNYSGSNPPYLHHLAVQHLVDCGIEHLLVDLPSVDREQDGGQLLSHKAFWRYPDAIREQCSITELIYVPEGVRDGWYLLNLQIAPFELDASPSKPVIYHLEPHND